MADSFLDKSGLTYLWSKIKQYFVEKETGKGLSTNDYTDAEKAKIANALIPSDSDLNDITGIGWYRATTTVAASLTNCPVTVGFYMEVKAVRSAGGRYQHIVTYSTTNSRHYQRTYDGTWGEWKEWKLTDTTYEAATTSAPGLMSAADKTKLDGISAGANVNVQADWNETDNTSDSYILNKPFTSISKTVTVYSSPQWTKEYTDASDCKLASCIMKKDAAWWGVDGGGGYTDFSLSIGSESGSTFITDRTYNITLGTKLYAGTINLKTGEVIATWYGVDGGSIGWSLSSYSTDDKKIFATPTLTDRRVTDQAQTVVVGCIGYSFYKNSISSGASSMPDMSIMPRSNHVNVYFRDDRYSTAADFKTAMTGKIIIYALAESTTSQITPIDVRLNKGSGVIFNNDYDKAGGLSYTLTYITEAFQPLVNALS